MIPSREKAIEILTDAANHNPGAWERHSYLVAQCAERIADACGDMNTEKAYILGLLHDIGRHFGVSQLRHVYDGWKYMLGWGYDEVAKCCLTHSFCIQEKNLEDYMGKHDITEQQKLELSAALRDAVYDDYDLLIQLSDSLAGGERIMTIEERMQDVKNRYGSFPQDKWDKNLAIKAYFEQRTGRNIYEIIDL